MSDAEGLAQRALGDDSGDGGGGGETFATDPALDAAARERIALRGKSPLGAFLAAALQGRAAGGACSEYVSACGLDAGSIPIDLFEQDRPRELRGEQHRAATPAPATGTGVNVGPISPYIFSPSIAPKLGISVPQVQSGAHTVMTITTALPAAPKAAGADADNTAGALTPVTTSPRAIRARMTTRIEDLASVGQADFEASLRRNVSMSLSAAYDNQCINGSGVDPNINGLVAQLTAPATPTAIAAFDDFVEAFVDQIDGLWAAKPSEVSIVANVDAFKLSGKTFRDGTGGQSRAGERAFSEYAESNYGGWWTNKRMPATAATIARGIVYRMGQPGVRTAVHPTWGSIAIDDIYTDSRSGQRHYTIHLLVGDKVLIVQPDAYDLVEFKVA